MGLSLNRGQPFFIESTTERVLKPPINKWSCFMRLIVFLLLFVISLTFGSCKSLLYNAIASTQDNNEQFESLVYSDPRIDSFKSLPAINDSLIAFIKLDSLNFRKLLNNRFNETKSNYLFIYFWSLAYSDSLLNLDMLKKIQNIANKQLIIISTDISSRDQIQLLKHYLFKNGFSGQYYIIKTKSGSIMSAIEDMKTLSSFYSIHNNLKLQEGVKLTMPVFYVIDQDMKVVFKSSLNDNNVYERIQNFIK
jgi:hypothetical protein